MGVMWVCVSCARATVMVGAKFWLGSSTLSTGPQGRRLPRIYLCLLVRFESNHCSIPTRTTLISTVPHPDPQHQPIPTVVQAQRTYVCTARPRALFVLRASCCTAPQAQRGSAQAITLASASASALSPSTRPHSLALALTAWPRKRAGAAPTPASASVRALSRPQSLALALTAWPSPSSQLGSRPHSLALAITAWPRRSPGRPPAASSSSRSPKGGYKEG